MKEQKLNERESLQVITAMIERTKQRLHLGDGNILLMWGYLTVTISILVSTLLYFTGNVMWNWLWLHYGLLAGY